jgi:hypothetical protein
MASMRTVGRLGNLILGRDGRSESPVVIPRSHLDLVECPPVAALTTVMPDGTPQTSVVWVRLRR